MESLMDRKSPREGRIMVAVTPEELERLGIGLGTPPQEDARTREEKMSDFASTRDRDEQGRFLSQKERERMEIEAFYYTPYKVVYKPKTNGPDHVLVRQELMYWHQKAYIWVVLGVGAVMAYAAIAGSWEGLKWLLFR